MAEEFAEFIARLRIEDDRAVLQSLRQTETAIVATATRSQSAFDKMTAAGRRLGASLTGRDLRGGIRTLGLVAAAGFETQSKLATAATSAAGLVTVMTALGAALPIAALAALTIGLINYRKEIAEAISGTRGLAEASEFLKQKQIELDKVTRERRGRERVALTAEGDALQDVIGVQPSRESRVSRIQERGISSDVARRLVALEDHRLGLKRAEAELLDRNAKREKEITESKAEQLAFEERIAGFTRERDATASREFQANVARREDAARQALIGIGAARPSDFESNNDVRDLMRLQERLGETGDTGGGRFGASPASESRFARGATPAVENVRTVQTAAEDVKAIRKQITDLSSVILKRIIKTDATGATGGGLSD